MLTNTCWWLCSHADMQIIKLDRRYRVCRLYGFQAALKFEKYYGPAIELDVLCRKLWPRPFTWTTAGDLREWIWIDWFGDKVTQDNGFKPRTYYIGFRNPADITFLMLKYDLVDPK